MLCKHMNGKHRFAAGVSLDFVGYRLPFGRIFRHSAESNTLSFSLSEVVYRLVPQMNDRLNDSVGFDARIRTW